MKNLSINNAIFVDRLSIKFNSRTVLNNLCLEIAQGESVAVVGANGSGKTTLLRCLAGLIRPGSGEIHWFCAPAVDKPSSRRSIGMVAHDGYLYPHLTASENLLFAARMYGVNKPGERVEELIKIAHMEAYAYRQARKLSRGMRQRLSILRAIVHDPKILILDEPFAALDQAGTHWLESLLEELRRQGCTLCFTAHDLQLAQAHSDRVLELRSGILEVKQYDEEFGLINKQYFKAA